MPRRLHVPKLVWLVSAVWIAGLATAAGCAGEAEPIRARQVLAVAAREARIGDDELSFPNWLMPPPKGSAHDHGKSGHGKGGGPLPKCLEEELEDEDLPELDDELPFSGKSDKGYDRKPGRENRL